MPDRGEVRKDSLFFQGIPITNCLSSICLQPTLEFFLKDLLHFKNCVQVCAVCAWYVPKSAGTHRGQKRARSLGAGVIVVIDGCELHALGSRNQTQVFHRNSVNS